MQEVFREKSLIQGYDAVIDCARRLVGKSSVCWLKVLINLFHANTSAPLKLSSRPTRVHPGVAHLLRIVHIDSQGAWQVRGAAAFDIPVFVTEQYPARLGSTVQEIKEVLPQSCVPVAKTDFTMFGKTSPLGLHSSAATQRQQHVTGHFTWMLFGAFVQCLRYRSSCGSTQRFRVWCCAALRVMSVYCRQPWTSSVSIPHTSMKSFATKPLPVVGKQCVLCVTAAVVQRESLMCTL